MAIKYELGSMCCSVDFKVEKGKTICKKCKNICKLWSILKVDKDDWKKYVK